MTNYDKSNSIETLPTVDKIQTSTKKLFNSFREEKSCSQTILQIISNAICKDLNVDQIKISFSGKQPKRYNGKGLGFYARKSTGYSYIQVYQYTASQFKQVATKTAIDTLLHELIHYFDYEILKLNDSIHSKGFYMRISSLKNTLLS